MFGVNRQCPNQNKIIICTYIIKDQAKSITYLKTVKSRMVVFFSYQDNNPEVQSKGHVFLLHDILFSTYTNQNEKRTCFI